MMRGAARYCLEEEERLEKEQLAISIDEEEVHERALAKIRKILTGGK